MPDRTLNATQTKAADAFLDLCEQFADAWAAQRMLSGRRLTAVARCRDLKIPAEHLSELTRDRLGDRGLSPGRIHQFYMELDGAKRYHKKDDDA